MSSQITTLTPSCSQTSLPQNSTPTRLCCTNTLTHLANTLAPLPGWTDQDAEHARYAAAKTQRANHADAIAERHRYAMHSAFRRGAPPSPPQPFFLSSSRTSSIDDLSALLTRCIAARPFALGETCGFLGGSVYDDGTEAMDFWESEDMYLRYSEDDDDDDSALDYDLEDLDNDVDEVEDWEAWNRFCADVRGGYPETIPYGIGVRRRRIGKFARRVVVRVRSFVCLKMPLGGRGRCYRRCGKV